jgi:hypothetical protein
LKQEGGERERISELKTSLEMAAAERRTKMTELESKISKTEGDLKAQGESKSQYLKQAEGQHRKLESLRQVRYARVVRVGSSRFIAFAFPGTIPGGNNRYRIPSSDNPFTYATWSQSEFRILNREATRPSCMTNRMCGID